MNDINIHTTRHQGLFLGLVFFAGMLGFFAGMLTNELQQRLDDRCSCSAMAVEISQERDL